MSSTPDRPLDGVKIIDFSNMLMAPYMTQILGDMGADVIKVEAPDGDPVRLIGPARNRGHKPSLQPLPRSALISRAPGVGVDRRTLNIALGPKSLSWQHQCRLSAPPI